MACQRAGVTCMEVQHGVAGGAGHRWYSSWKKLPESGERYGMLPDLYWCWTKEDKDAIDSWSCGRHVAFQGGRPIQSVLNDLEPLTQKHPFPADNGKKSILFSLQPGVLYSEWLIDTIKGTCEQINWLIRKHPHLDQTQADFIRRISGLPNVHVDGMESILLEKLLAHVDLHLTSHSSVVMDALFWWVPSIILSEKYKQLYQKEIDAGMVVFCGNRESFEETLCEMLKKKKEPVNPQDLRWQSEQFLEQQICI